MKFLKKFIWFFVFVIVAIVALIAVFIGVKHFEFNDSVKYKNINYSNVEKNVCLSFNNDGYILNNCNGGETDFLFDSSKNCKMNYGKGYSSIIFDCGIGKINLVKIDEFSFNKIKFSNKNKDYVLINNSTFTTMEGLQKIDFSFVDEKNIKFSKYINDNLVDEEVCNYSYGRDESVGLECNRFYGYSSFKIEEYTNDKVIIINRGNKITFNLSN